MSFEPPPAWMRASVASPPIAPTQPIRAQDVAAIPQGEERPDCAGGVNYVDDVFGPSGYLSRRFPGYTVRPGQVAFAQAVDVSIRGHQHLLAEAAVGIGKSLAYLVPATYHAVRADKRVLVVTANIALQEQLIRKDLPALADILPWKFTFGLIKGRNNYLCQAQRITSRLGASEGGEAAQIARWAATTRTGDMSELPFKPQPATWRRFSVTGEDCPKGDCSHNATCFAERALAAAFGARVVVTNYHMLFAHLLVRGMTGGAVGILPRFDILIGDEGHEIASIARDFFGFRITEASIKWAARRLADIGSGAFASRLEQRSGRFFSELRDFRQRPIYKARLRKPDPVPWQDLHDLLKEAAELYRLGAKNDAEAAPHLRLAQSRCVALSKQLAAAMSLSDDGSVYFLEEDEKRRVALCAKPLDVSRRLRTDLYDRTPTVIACSATLAVGGSFEHCMREIGAPPEKTGTLMAGTPFNLPEQMRLVLPRKMPPPTDPAWGDAVAATFAEVIDAAQGRTLGLFTSHKMLKKVHEYLQHNGCRWRVLKQGDLPPTQLIEEFRRDTHSVLIGTATFWQGVDVPGEALSCVVIDRLPFPSPEDPILDGISARDRNAFMNYSVPHAVIAFKQGVGRLIRSAKDRGVVVVLDRRVQEKGYGPRHFLSTFPPGVLAFDAVSDIAAFLG